MEVPFLNRRNVTTSCASPNYLARDWQLLDELACFEEHCENTSEEGSPMADAPYIINGGLGSPYSHKMRAIFRYRRIPHIWNELTGTNRDAVFSEVKVPVIPIIKYPDGSFHNDSTPMIIDLEAAVKGRSIVPEDEAQAFVSWFLEDMGDEWATK